MGEPNTANRYYPHKDGHSPNWNILVSEEKKSIEIPRVVTSETGSAQTFIVPSVRALQWRGCKSVLRDSDSPGNAMS